MDTTAPAPAQAKNSLLVELPVFIAVRTATNTMVRLAYPFLPIFGRLLGVDLYWLSRAITLRSATGLLGPFIASVGDSRGRKFGMLLGMSLFTIGAGVMAVWPSYPAFVVMLVLGIMASFVFLPSMQAYLGDKVPYARRGRVLGLTEFGWSLAFIIGVPAIGFAIASAGTMAVRLQALGIQPPDRFELVVPFAWLTGLGVLSILVLAWMLPKDHPAAAAERPGLLRNLGRVLASRPARAGLLLAIAMSGANELINLVFGVWLADAYQVDIAALSITAFVIGSSELGGESLVTGLVDRLGKRRSVGLGLALNALAALGLVLLGRSLSGAMIGLFLFYITFEFTVVSSMPLMTEVLPAARATFMAAFIASTALGRSAGSLAAPWLYDLGKLLTPGSALFVIAAATAGVNMLALLALRRIPETQQT